MARKVRAPDGVEWRVGRQWSKHRARLRHAIGADGLDAVQLLDLADDPTGLFFAIGVVVTIVAVFFFAVFFVFPLVIFVVEVLLVATLAAAGILARVLFRRPWVVFAEPRGSGSARTWKRVGWRASARLIDDISTALQRGTPLPF